jgi:hypothetical protein
MLAVLLLGLTQQHSLVNAQCEQRLPSAVLSYDRTSQLAAANSADFKLACTAALCIDPHSQAWFT